MSLAFIQSHIRARVHVYACVCAPATVARECLVARRGTRASLVVRPCKILSSFAPHRLHLVYPRGERGDKCRDPPDSPPPPLSSSAERIETSARARARAYLSARAQKCRTIVAASPQWQIITDRSYEERTAFPSCTHIHPSIKDEAVDLGAPAPLSRRSFILILALI